MAGSREALPASEVEAALADLPGWTYEEDRLERTFSFGSFREAMSFMVRIGFEAEDMDHHPELSNVYSMVAVGLTTHDAGDRVSELDIELARRINRIVWVQ